MNHAESPMSLLNSLSVDVWNEEDVRQCFTGGNRHSVKMKEQMNDIYLCKKGRAGTLYWQMTVRMNCLEVSELV